MAICAYCGQDRKATREHVIPSFLYAFQEEIKQSTIGWNEVVGKMIKAESKVRDVCAECNNGPLSQLDDYGKKILVESGILVKNYEKTTLSFRYEYSLLLRWLLKISFNSSRTDGAHAPLFEEYVDFIIGSVPPPPRYRIAAFLYLAAPENIAYTAIPVDSFIKVADGSDRLNPFFVRISYGALTDKVGCILRVVAFGPAVFHLFMFPKNTLPGHAASKIRSLMKARPEAVELSENRKVVVVHAGSESWLDLYAPQILRARAMKQLQ